jgi:L-asparaginase
MNPTESKQRSDAGPAAFPGADVRAEVRSARVHILATGGTIAGEAASETDQVYRPAEVEIGKLIDAVPALRDLATVTAEQFAQVSSQDIGDHLWIRLARRINDLFKSDATDGVVVTHGTDTAEETGYFLHLAVKSDRPIVLTGAMRPASSLSADGPLNLYNAVAAAADPDACARGVMLVVNDNLHCARDVTKSHTTDVQTFTSPGPGLIGEASFGKIRYFRYPTRRHTLGSEFDIERIAALPRVDILYAHADMAADLVSASHMAGARGIVVAGVGNGNIPNAVAQALADVARAGIIVVRSSRVGSGAVIRNAEVDDDALGLVVADQLTPQKSRVLLQLCLSQHMQAPAVQDAFLRY